MSTVLIGDSRRQNNEFVTADPRNCVAGSHGVQHALGTDGVYRMSAYDDSPMIDSSLTPIRAHASRFSAA
ncbi:hypothetical protein [Pelomonas sp. Root1237]|uniref:hypothetical protein n=1 Tax=Pelomonas sp. Root1237 TaxID=1736434 RepID=UPI000A82A7B6|nr:hypothetical protein [Pelomonas sp. Root1237]